MVALSQTDATIRTVDRLQADLGLLDSEPATVLGVSADGLRHWRSGASSLGSEPLRRLRGLTAFAVLPGETFKTVCGSHWLRSESGYLDG